MSSTSRIAAAAPYGFRTTAGQPSPGHLPPPGRITILPPGKLAKISLMLAAILALLWFLPLETGEFRLAQSATPPGFPESRELRISIFHGDIQFYFADFTWTVSPQWSWQWLPGNQVPDYSALGEPHGLRELGWYNHVGIYWSRTGFPDVAGHWRFTTTSLDMSLLYFIPLFMVLPLGKWRKALILSRRQEMGLCERCGYDLLSSPGRCPECGWNRS